MVPRGELKSVNVIEPAIDRIPSLPWKYFGPMKHYYQILRNHERPLRFIAARLLVTTRFCLLFKIRQNGYKLRFFPSNLSCSLWINPIERAEALRFFRAYLKLGDRVVDVGANIGDTVLTASPLVGEKGKIYAFEPHPRIYGYLKKNLALNRVHRVETHNVALGVTPGQIFFSDNRRDDMNRVNGEQGGFEVKVERLDDLISATERVQLLKVDVEGYEKFVLAGAEKLLTVTDCIHFEVGSEHFGWFGYTVRDLLQFLRDRGFMLYRIQGPDCLNEVDVDYQPVGVENVLAMRNLQDFQLRTGWRLYRASEIP